MGMDISGKAPRSGKGEYVRFNVWMWHPLWDYCCDVGGVDLKMRDDCHRNDGKGLSDAESRALGWKLGQMIESGEVADYRERYMAKLDALPDEDCSTCGGTGRRAEPPHPGPGVMPCNGCGGKLDGDVPGRGKVRPWATWYPFEVEWVREFSDFLKDCGGFEVF